MRKIVKTTTVGSLKSKLNESKGNFALGQGFGSEPRFKSNVQDNSAYNRKLDKNGGFGLGDGFTKLNEEEMVDFIANIVENMKGKTEYHNLKFVDRIGNENGLFESQIKNIKNIIKSDRTPYQLKLRKYLTENVAEEMSEIYEGYSGLMHESEMMVNEIKATFNEMKSMGKTTNEAVTMTAEALDVPMEMVDKMVQVQKEAYKARMEGMGEPVDINEKLCEVYEAYQNMAEGNMKPVYEELKEMMNPEPEEPEESEESEYGEYGDFGTEKEYGEYLRGSEESREDYEARKYDSDKRDIEDTETYFPLEEDLCMECDDMDDESYIEVELSSPKDFALLPMLAKGAMSASRMPSMGMSKMSRAMNVPMEKDYEDYEVPMDYSTSNPYSQYRYDTGLGKIPYGKKKFMSDEGEEGAMTMYESAMSEKRKKMLIKEAKAILKALSQPFKISNCGKYLMFENKIYYTRNGELVSNKIITENRLLNERTWGEWGLDMAQGAASVGSMFLPGGGSVIEILNALVYFTRAATTSDEERKGMLYTSGMISLVVSIMPTVLGAMGAAIKAFFIGGGKVLSKTLIKPLSTFLTNMNSYLPKIKTSVDAATKSKWATSILGKWALKISKWFDEAVTATKSTINRLLGKSGKDAYKAVPKAGDVLPGGFVMLSTKGGQLAAKKNFNAFFGKILAKGEAAGKGTAWMAVKGGQTPALMKALKYKVGTSIIINGKKAAIKEIGENSIKYAAKGGAIKEINTTIFLEQAIKTPFFQTYVGKVIANPSSYAVGAKFLQGFLFGKDGSVTIDPSKMEGAEIPLADALAAENIELEGGEYGGDTGQYTANDQVTAVQTALQTLGENLGGAGVDGKYGPVTRGAINAVEDKVGVPKTTGNITFKSVIAIIIALVQKGKIAEAKELAAAVQDSEIKNNVDMILNSSTFTNQIKMGMLKALVSGEKPSTEKTSWMPDFMKGVIDTPVSENTFSENYKRMFGLTLD